jgi:hypothetical protein
MARVWLVYLSLMKGHGDSCGATCLTRGFSKVGPGVCTTQKSRKTRRYDGRPFVVASEHEIR